MPREAVLASATAIYRGTRRVPTTAPLYRLYACLHCIMPLRHLRFLPRRALAFLKRKCKKSR